MTLVRRLRAPRRRASASRAGLASRGSTRQRALRLVREAARDAAEQDGPERPVAAPICTYERVPQASERAASVLTAFSSTASSVASADPASLLRRGARRALGGLEARRVVPQGGGGAMPLHEDRRDRRAATSSSAPARAASAAARIRRFVLRSVDPARDLVGRIAATAISGAPVSSASAVARRERLGMPHPRIDPDDDRVVNAFLLARVKTMVGRDRRPDIGVAARGDAAGLSGEHRTSTAPI